MEADGVNRASEETRREPAASKRGDGMVDERGGRGGQSRLESVGREV